jgi:hypothetical protein
VSYKLVSAILRQRNDCTATQKLVLLVLADCERDGLAFPSVATIVERGRVSERAARYALRYWRKRHVIADAGPVPGQYAGRRYRLASGAPDAPLESASGAPDAPLESASGVHVVRPGVQEVQSRGAGGAPKVVRKRQGSDKGTRAGARHPRTSDIGLTAEEIAEKNRLDLDWKRKQGSKSKSATDSAQPTQAQLDALARLKAKHAAADAAKSSPPTANAAGSSQPESR